MNNKGIIKAVDFLHDVLLQNDEKDELQLKIQEFLSKNPITVEMTEDEFYNEFNLSTSSYSEFNFKEMKEIFHLPVMDTWPELITRQEDKPLPMYFSMVCFSPPDPKTSPNGKRICTASRMACKVLCSSFVADEDHACINMAMDNYPTIAIFMCQDLSQEKMHRIHKLKPPLRKSMLDLDDQSSLHCLAAVNYFQVGVKTHVLWLATTCKQPPIDSIHVTWQNKGLATYLLCMLVKQHTAFGNLADSVISLQSSQNRNDSARSFYLSLGF